MCKWNQVKMQVKLIALLLLLFVVGCKHRRSISLCYDPDLEGKESRILRIVDTFDGSLEEVNALFALSQRSDLPQGNYSFCGIVCYIVFEINDKPVRMAEVLMDGRTVTISSFANESPWRIEKRDGEYVVYDNERGEKVQGCFDIPMFCTIAKRLSGRLFDKIEKDYNPVDGFN